MGMLFVNIDKEDVKFQINNRGWRRIHRLAVMFGWKPQGTREYLAFFKEPWDSCNYFTNDGQLVTQKDTLALADAIEWAITKLKEEDPDDDPEKKYGSSWEFEMIRRMEIAMSVGLKDPGYIFFSTFWTNKLTEFVGFCRQGAFVIY